MILLHFPVFELAGFQKLSNSLTSRRAGLPSSQGEFRLQLQLYFFFSMALIGSNFLLLSITVSKNLTAWNNLIPQHKNSKLFKLFLQIHVFSLFLKEVR